MRDLVFCLPYSLEDIGLRGNIQQPLVGFRVLNHGFRFAIYGKDYRPLRLLKALHEFAGLAAEGGQGLNVFGNVEHQKSFPETPLKVLLVAKIVRKKKGQRFFFKTNIISWSDTSRTGGQQLAQS
jgi:hypothetical protein